ncbi:MAG: adenosine kinase [Gammaproteobacteria bacterium]|nr:adenosine kinase [Gammaproteobacteria bacterium]HBW82489.1 adenosine kinase [Gammaproteobacteria bacterium]
MKYDVYGIGNALVDKEFEIDDSFLDEFSIEKGIMTLVDLEQQEQLLSELTGRFGVKTRSGGGSAANTLYAISQFGGSTFYSCRVASDETGDFFLQQLGDHRIQTNKNRQQVEGVSGRCLVMVTPDAERTMLTYLGVSDSISTLEMDFEAALNSTYIYLEGYLVTSDAARSAIIEMKDFAKSKGVKTAMTFSDPSMLEYFKADVNRVIGEGVDLLFCNRQEALLWSGAKDLSGAIEALKRIAGQFAVTTGSEGSILWDGGQLTQIAPVEVPVIDTNGAGDMYAGAFLYGITNGMSFAEAGALASKASAAVVTQYGPRLAVEAHNALLGSF